jgi:hypothetical protein
MVVKCAGDILTDVSKVHVINVTKKKKNPVGARLFSPVQTGPGAQPTSCTMGTGSFPGVASGWSVTLTLHSLLVPRSKNRVSYTSTDPKGLRGL